MNIRLSDLVGILIGIVVIAVIIGFVRRVNEISEPCYQPNIERRQVLIESHERCMSEANCIYEEWDIRKYDKWLEKQAMCEANRNE